MNRYTPENMVKVSRYAAYFPTLDKELQSKVFGRIGQLLSENREYCDKGNVKHMGAITTSIALYEELQKKRHGRAGSIQNRIRRNVEDA